MVTGLPVVQFRATQVTPFFQDTWRVTRSQTFNYGVSWFYETPPAPQGWARDLVHRFDPGTGLILYSGLGQTGSGIMQPDRNNVAPRFGLARPGLKRMAVIEHTQTLPNVAFQTPEGRIVLIVANDTESVSSFAVQYNGQVANIRLNPGAVGSYVW